MGDLIAAPVRVYAAPATSSETAMSFSISVRAATKEEAKAKVAEELAKVVALQPVHEVDQPLIQTTADSYIDLLRDASDRDVAVLIHGSVQGSDGELYAASVGVQAHLAKKE